MNIRKLTIINKDRMLHFSIGNMLMLPEVSMVLSSISYAKSACILKIPLSGAEDWVLTRDTDDRLKDFVYKGLIAFIEPRVERRVK
jgi:hypothetical protein